MKELIIGTKNQAKLNQIKGALSSFNIDITGLPTKIDLPEIIEDKETAQENAKKKAMFYSQFLNKVVLSMDNALYIKGLNPNKQPGIHIRRIDKRTDRPSDKELLNYYQKILKPLGNKIHGHWEFAICLAYPNGQFKEITIISPRIFTSQKSEKMIKGYPLESLQIDPKSGKYISEMSKKEQDIFWNKMIGTPLKNFLKDSI